MTRTTPRGGCRCSSSRPMPYRCASSPTTSTSKASEPVRRRSISGRPIVTACPAPRAAPTTRRNGTRSAGGISRPCPATSGWTTGTAASPRRSTGRPPAGPSRSCRPGAKATSTPWEPASARRWSPGKRTASRAWRRVSLRTRAAGSTTSSGPTGSPRPTACRCSYRTPSSRWPCSGTTPASRARRASGSYAGRSRTACARRLARATRMRTSSCAAASRPPSGAACRRPAAPATSAFR